jgi:uncharacterized repeat protein (TIGR01451 family)
MLFRFRPAAAAAVLAFLSALPSSLQAQQAPALRFAVAGAAVDPKPGTLVPADTRPPVPLSLPAGVTAYSPAVVPTNRFQSEVEPNNTSATATTATLNGAAAALQGDVFPGNDVDFYAFTANAGDRVYAATMTSLTGRALFDSELALLASDGTTVIELDNDDGSFGASSSSIAGATVPAAGTYYLRVRYQSSTTLTINPYRLYLQVRSGTPTAETEPNDSFPGQALPASGWVSGSTSATTDVDFYSISLAAGETVYLSLDLDAERDTTEWNGQLGLGSFGTPPSILVVNDAGTSTPDSEAYFLTAKDAGTYAVFVGLPAGGTTFGTYQLNVTRFPAVDDGVNCTTYTSANVPVTIPTGPGVVTSTLTVPGNPRIHDIDVSVQLTHNFMADLDVQLTAPAGVGGNTVGLFSDIGSTTAGAQTTMDVTFDDEAAIPSAFQIVQGLRLAPELNYRLNWFDGQPAGGDWTLTLRDDATGDGGTLTGWSLRICEPPPPPTCPAGFAPVTVYSTDFEANDGGFTSSGTQNEWERGTPAFAGTTTAAAFNGCNSGANCFKTDLDNTYNASADQTLLSPGIDLTGLSPPVIVNWAQKFQMESAAFDRFRVDVNQVGTPANTANLYAFLDADMFETVGSTPLVNNNQVAGWGQYSRRIDAFAGQNVELRFNVVTDTSVQRTGVGIDDVSVTACRALSADLAITKTDGATSEVPGTPVTYTITASNAGPDAVTGATVADTFPAVLTGCTWTCVGASGGTCTAAGSGNINDTVNLPANGSATYTATCNISPAATGTLANTATVNSTISDPTPANNSATDTNTLTPQADLAITKTNGTAASTPGTPTTWTITASNAGPSHAPGSTVADTFPAACTSVNWTCVGAGGGTCTAAGSGNINDVVNLPAGGSVTYSATCAISSAASGTLSNTATVSTAGGVADTNPGNNSATDTDTLAASADVAITKTNNTTAPVPGTTTTYVVTASNAGPSPAASVTIADTFPTACTSVTWTCTGAGGGTCTGSGTGNINQSVNLPASASVTFTATCALAAGATGTLANTATATVGGGVTDPTPGNNSATDTDTLAPSTDLSVTKTNGTTSVQPGATTTWTIVAANAGPSTATGATLTDTFPAACTSVSWTCAAAGGASCPAGAGSGNISASLNVPVGGSVTYTATCTISASATGTLANTATVAAGAGATDPGTGNNTATDTDSILLVTDLAIGKTSASGTFTANSAVTWTLVASNAGPGTATGAQVTDTFPAACSSVSWSCTASGGGACPASGSGNIAAAVTLPAGATATFTATCQVGATASGPLVNTATIAPAAGAFDPTPANATATSTLQFVVLVPVDTVGLRGLLLLMLAMVLVGAWRLQRPV